jgi:trk system potassium uptake protein
MVNWLPSVRLPQRQLHSARKIQAGPPLVLSGGLLVLIVLGMLLLKLPAATTDSISWMQSLFTATSAVTVTGLVVVDTGTAFTTFGQIIIALLIQLGGLGLMTFAVVTLLALGGKIGFMQQSIAKEAFNQTDMSTLASTAKSVLLFALIVETIGIAILTLYWMPELGLQTSFMHAFFYTISAFNNAGFALSADSLMPYVADPVINITITALFITGGLGFSVWIDIWRKKSWSKLTVYSRLMLTGTVLINLIALICIYLIEYDNPTPWAHCNSQANGWQPGFRQSHHAQLALIHWLSIS